MGSTPFGDGCSQLVKQHLHRVYGRGEEGGVCGRGEEGSEECVGGRECVWEGRDGDEREVCVRGSFCAGGK